MVPRNSIVLCCTLFSVVLFPGILLQVYKGGGYSSQHEISFINIPRGIYIYIYIYIYTYAVFGAMVGSDCCRPRISGDLVC